MGKGSSESADAQRRPQPRRRRRSATPSSMRCRMTIHSWLLVVMCLVGDINSRTSTTVHASLTVGSGQAAASETAPDMQTTVIRGTFQGGGWKGDPQIGARVYWDNTQKAWLYVDAATEEDELFENMECAVTRVEREALLDLFESAGGAAGLWQDAWYPDDYPCPCIFGWHGIKCDRYGAVKEINLAYNGLQGSLPASLQNLQSLTLLAVNSNDLTGAFPEINATSLEVLYVDAKRKQPNPLPDLVFVQSSNQRSVLLLVGFCGKTHVCCTLLLLLSGGCDFAGGWFVRAWLAESMSQ